MVIFSISITNGRLVSSVLVFLFSSAILIASGISSHAHKPDRCFHSHFGGTTKCKKGIVKKRCTDEDGNVGRCVQQGSHCFCRITKKKSSSSGEKLIDLGTGIGNAVLDKERRKKQHHNKKKHQNNHRDEMNR